MASNTNQVKKYFEELAKIRANNLSNIRKQTLTIAPINIIYELLQNADNAQATYATIKLYGSNLVFKHNGQKHFTISNPASEEEDLKSNKLGDVNAITSITNFNQIEPKIGNIGYGIKSIFEYTQSLFIYDTNFCFKIDQYVIPSLLTEDYKGRQKDETILVIPLNPTAFNKIVPQLKNIYYPNLFLKTIKIITYTIENQITGKIERNIELEMNYADIKVEYISFIHQKGDIQLHQRYWILSRLVKTYPISIAFYTSDDGFLKPLSPTSAFCFFQTGENTNLNYFINAPFLLTVERTKIKPDDAHNKLMINELANLSAKSLTIFKDIGQKYDVKLINDTVLSIYPTEKFLFGNIKNTISFFPIFDEVQKVFLSEEIIPTEKGFTSKKNAYWASDSALLDLINNEQLTLLVNNPNAKWVFRSLDKLTGIRKIEFICSIVQAEICDYTLFNSKEKKPNITGIGSSFNNIKKAQLQKSFPVFIDCFEPTSSDENLNPFASFEFIVPPKQEVKSASSFWGKNSSGWGQKSTRWGESTYNSGWGGNKSIFAQMTQQKNENALNSIPKDDQNKIIFKGISAEFIEKQSFEWLNSFYKWICLDDWRMSLAKTFPIFLDNNKKAVSAFDPQNKNLQLFFPVFQKAEQNYLTVNQILLKNEENFFFMRKIGISLPLNIKSYIHNFILEQSNMIKQSNYADYFKKIVFYYQFCSLEEQLSFINDLQNTDIILFNTKEDKLIQIGKPDTIYFPNQILINYFELLPQTRFICIDTYNKIFGENKEQKMKNFLILLGVKNDINIIEKQVDYSELNKYKIRLPYSTCGQNCIELIIDGFDEVFDIIQKNHNKSLILWNILLHLSKNNALEQFYEGTCKYFYHSDLTVKYPSIFRQKLINEKWLITSQNEFVAPIEIFLKELPKEYNIDDPAVPALADFLNIKRRNVRLLTTEYINDHDFVERAKKAGLLEKFMKELETKESESKK